MGRTLKTLAFACAFVGGYELCLPDVGVGVRISIAHGVFLSNLLVIAYTLLLVCAGGTGRLVAVLRRRRPLALFLLISALGLLGIVSSGVNTGSLLDLGQAARMLLLAEYFVLLVYWSRVHGPAFVLRGYLLGIACGGLLNLYYTVRIPVLVVLNALPVLYSSNGAGGLLGMGVVLGAWLFVMRRSRLDSYVAFAVSGVGVAAASLSYSKTAMLIAFLGLLGWASVMLRRSALPAWRWLAVGSVASLIVMQTVSPFGMTPTKLTDTVVQAVEVKFGNMTFDKKFGIDDYAITGSRYAYWPMTFRVLVRHPIVGVGYSGLYDAYMDARKGYEELALIENPEARTTNPHNSFLYYVAANGMFGVILVTWIFLKTMRILLRSCAVYGLQGRLLWFWMATAYLAFGFTLPTLFNTELLYLPAAVGIVHGATRPARRVRALLASARPVSPLSARMTLPAEPA